MVNKDIPLPLFCIRTRYIAYINQDLFYCGVSQTKRITVCSEQIKEWNAELEGIEAGREWAN